MVSRRPQIQKTGGVPTNTSGKFYLFYDASFAFIIAGCQDYSNRRPAEKEPGQIAFESDPAPFSINQFKFSLSDKLTEFSDL